MNMSLLDCLAGQSGVFISDLRLCCPLLALFKLLEIEDDRFLVSEWNEALSYISGDSCSFMDVTEAKEFTRKLIRRW